MNHFESLLTTFEVRDILEATEAVVESGLSQKSNHNSQV